MANNKKKYWIIALIAIIILLGIAAYFKAKNKPRGTEVTVETVSNRTILEKVSASGKIFPEVEVKISSDVSGEIVDLYVEEGDSVSIGQVLAKIDPDSYVSSVEAGEAALNNAKAQRAMANSQVESSIAQKEQIVSQLENAKTIYSRNQQLFKDGVVSQMELDQSTANLKNLEANLKASLSSIKSSQESAKGADFMVKSSEANLKELKTSLRRTTITAPASGIISNLSVEKGERVVGTIQMAGTEMMRISNLNTMEVQVEVSENDIIKVALDDEVDIDVDAYLDNTFKGKVTQIANSASNINSLTGNTLNTDQVTNFIVKVRMEPSSYLSLGKRFPFRPGMSASVEIYTNKQSDVLAVPIMSVTTREKNENQKKKTMSKDIEEELNVDDLEEVVFVVKNDTIAKTVVTTGIQDDEYIQILSGISDGEKVVTGPFSAISKTLKQGDTVYESKEKEKKDN